MAEENGPLWLDARRIRLAEEDDPRTPGASEEEYGRGTPGASESEEDECRTPGTSEKEYGRGTPGASESEWEERRTPGTSEEEWRVRGRVRAPDARCVRVRGGIRKTDTRRVQGGVRAQDAWSARGEVRAPDAQRVRGGVRARDARRVGVRRGGRAQEEEDECRTPDAS